MEFPTGFNQPIRETALYYTLCKICIYVDTPVSIEHSMFYACTYKNQSTTLKTCRQKGPYTFLNILFHISS